MSVDNSKLCISRPIFWLNQRRFLAEEPARLKETTGEEVKPNNARKSQKNSTARYSLLRFMSPRAVFRFYGNQYTNTVIEPKSVTPENRKP
nr:MAG TPA: hypothetical protein [Caudoviricetes sp.]